MSETAEIGLTHDRLRELLSYEPEAGKFIWKVSRGGITPGTVAGAADQRGYMLIRVDGVLYRACRLAWFYMTGEWPKEQIDHKNLNQGDDSWDNLRLASNGQNGMNKRVRRDCFSGLKGAHYFKRDGTWYSSISVNGKRHNLGTFPDAISAHNAYAAAAQKFHGKFARAK